jgi:NADPH:quinone reductase-like Zn-dependent oxidoreductase
VIVPYPHSGVRSLPRGSALLWPDRIVAGSDLCLVLPKRLLSPGSSARSWSPLSRIPTRRRLTTLRDLIASGKISVVIDRTYKLADTAEAIRYVEAGHARGKVIVIV